MTADLPPFSPDVLHQQVADLADDVFPFAVKNADDAWSVEALQSIGRRWRDTQTAVVFAGEVSTGKSKLINALIGDDLLPTDFKAKSSTWVQISFADRFQAKAQLRMTDGSLQSVGIVRVDLDTYLSVDGEEALRQRHGTNTKVLSVEIGLPARLLAGGLVLIDTPGVGGLDAAHRMAAISGLANADAVVITTKPGTPISESERRFLAEAIDRVEVCILAFTHRDLVADPDVAVEQDTALLTDAGQWSKILDGDAVKGVEIAERLRSLSVVSVSAVNALAARTLTGEAARLRSEAGNLTMLEDVLARDVVERTAQIHRRRVVTLCRRLSVGVATVARERYGLLSGAEEAFEALEERRLRLEKWAEGNGDYWRNQFTHELNTTLPETFKTIVDQRCSELRDSYWHRFGDLSKSELETTIEALRDTPQAVLSELMVEAGASIKRSMERVRTLLVEDDLDRALTILQETAQLSEGLRPEWSEPDGVALNGDDLLRGIYGGMAGAGLTSLAAQSLVHAGILAPLTPIPIFWPFAIGAAAMGFWTAKKRQKHRTADKAREFLVEVQSVVKGEVVSMARRSTIEAADTAMAEIAAGLAHLERQVLADQLLVADSVRLAKNPAERQTRLRELDKLATEADTLTARADELLGRL